MKLHSPQFQKALRQRVKRAVRSSPELKREFRRANRYRRNYSVAIVGRLGSSVVLAVLVQLAVSATGHVATGLAIINLWILGLVSFHAQGISTRLYRSPDLGALTLLPFPRGQIFRWQLQKYFRGSLLALIDLLAAFAMLGWMGANTPAQWFATFLVAILSWAALLALAVFCLARLPWVPVPIIPGGFILVGVIVFFGRTVLWPVLLAAIDHAAPVLNLILPTGWAVSLFQCFAGDHQWWMIILLLPVALILFTARESLKRLFAGYQYQERVTPESSDLVPGIAPQSRLRPREQPTQLGLTEIEEIIQSRQFLTPPAWSQRGRVERWLWQWFTAREQALSEFAFPSGMAITGPWIKTFRNLAIAAAFAFVAGIGSPKARSLVLGMGLFITTCQALGQILNQGRAFQPLRMSGVHIPMYAGFGIGFRELSRLLLKCSIIQIPLLLAFSLTAGILTAWLTGFPAVNGLVFGLRAACLVFASRFIFLVFAFSGGTNDSASFRLRSVMLLAVIVSFGIAFLALGVAGLFSPDQITSWLFCLGSLLTAYAFFRVYGWFYHAGKFDLMSLPRR
jgi:hypothetical protein